MNHLPYDAFNGSLVEQDLIHVVGNKKSSCESIKKMAIDDIRPQEEQVTEQKGSRVAAAPNSADSSDAVQLLLQHCSAAVSRLRAAVPHLCRQLQLTPLQLMDKAYNLHMSKVKMERPSVPLHSRRVVTTKSQVLFISNLTSLCLL